MQNRACLVSVIIPTTFRKELNDAVESVLSQSNQQFEILICVGSLRANDLILENQFSDPRVRVIPFTSVTNEGSGNVARNIGINNANGTYIAFLDDDDLWYPTKIETSLLAIESTPGPLLVMSAADLLVKGKVSAFAPRVPLKTSQTLSNYLFVRNSFMSKKPFVQTSTFFARSSLFRENFFDEKIQCHQDWDIAIRIERQGNKILYLSEKLICYRLNSVANTAKRTTWQASLDWLNQKRHLLSDEEVAHFEAGVISSRAAKSGDLRASFEFLVRGMFSKNLNFVASLVGSSRLFVFAIVKVMRGIVNG
jgi:glycosyltransferase involved in cell wall biosynthesis